MHVLSQGGTYISLLPVQICVTLLQCCVLSHSYCSKVRCTGHLGLSHMIHSMCHCSTPGVTYTMFCLCGLNHYYTLEMWKMCEFDNSVWWCASLRLCCRRNEAELIDIKDAYGIELHAYRHEALLIYKRVCHPSLF